jgi:C4-dicarboxylate-specific signal transduction histidine kinase
VGVIIVSVDLMKYERAWTGLQDAVMVTDSEGTVVLSTEPRWRGLPMADALALRDPPSAHGARLAGDNRMDPGPARRLCPRRGGDEDRGAHPVPGLEDRHLHRLWIRSASR